MRYSMPLRWAVVLTLLLGLLLPGFAWMAWNMQRTRESVIEVLKRDLDRSAKVLALSLVEPIWQVSPDLAKPMVEASFEDERFTMVEVFDANTPEPQVQRERPPAERAPGDNPSLWHTRDLPIEREGREIGRVKVTMSAAAPLIKARNDLLVEAIRTLALSALSMVLILTLLRRRVLNPMAALASAAAALGSGQLNRPIEGEGSDEIGRVAQAMERMRLALLEAFDRLRQHAQTLEEQVGQRTTELTRSNRELTGALDQLKTAQRELVESEKLASLGRLVAGVAHELNTPLGNALTVVTALEDRWRELDESLNSNQPLRRSQLSQIVSDTRRGQDILHRNVAKAADLVRDFKRVAIDQSNDVRRQFELGPMVRDVLLMVEPSYKNRPIKVVTHLAPDLEMDSFPGSLGLVLTNLIMNALIHGLHDRPDGTLTIEVKAAEPGWVELSVQDDGWGMDESVRRRIFDPFFTTKMGRGGTGLGMHIVHSIVTQLLGGQIDVLSEPGQGACMRLRLPTEAPQRPEGEPLQ